MGVTLERVQFKFASIIGELCNEPQILSQFAVWLDMRLAEFKLKGSISLDCSGEPVPPGWLEGLEEAMADQRSRKRKHRAHNVTTVPDDDDVIITDNSEIVPVSGHSHMGGNFSHNSSDTCESNVDRKRSHHSWHEEGFYNNGQKNQSFSVNNDNESITNQSLMSIVGDQVEEGHDLSQSRQMSSHNNLSQSDSIEQFELVEQTESEAKDLLQGNEFLHYLQPSSETSTTVQHTQRFPSHQSERASHHFNSFPYATGHPQRRERSIWSQEEKAAIHTYLLPIVQRTKKPPTKSEIQGLIIREPVLRHRHWEKIKFQAWSIYQCHVRRQNNLTGQNRSNKKDMSSTKTDSEQDIPQLEKTDAI